MKKEILLWMLLAWQSIPSITNPTSVKDIQSKKIFEVFGKNDSNMYRFSSNEISEILQENIKQHIIQGTIVYFEKDVTCTLTIQEKNQLKIDMEKYINKHPNIIKIKWNKVILDLDDDNFRELFRTLLPYLWRWDELKKYPDIIKSNDWLLIRHITKSRWSDAEKYFFHQFGYLIMRIVEHMPWDMTIWYYRQEMLKVVPNKHIKNTDYSDILDLSISELPKYF